MKSFKDLNKQVVQEGRPSQRHPLEGHEYHKKSDEALIHIAKDAHKAAEAMKSHNTDAENKYRDQANDSATVRYFRKKNGMPEWYKKKYGHVKEGVVEEGENNQVKDGDPCWTGYQMVGMKNKGGKKVPNCVPVKEAKDSVDEAAKGTLHRVRYSHDDSSGNGIASGNLSLHAPDKESASRYAESDLKKRGKKNIKIHAVTPQKSSIKEAKEKTEYDYEGDMARGQLQSIINNSQRVHDMLEDNDNLPEWVQSKITLAEDYISTVANYMMSEVDEEVEPIEELSRETLLQYTSRAVPWSVTHKSIASAARKDATAITDPNDHYGANDLRMKARGHSMIAKKRDAGIKKASARLKKDSEKNYYKDHWKANRGYYGPELPLQKEGVSKTSDATTSAEIGTPAQLSLKVTPKKLETPVYESRQLQIVREALADAKKKDAAKKKEKKVNPGGDDKFQAEPELTSSITKNT